MPYTGPRRPPLTSEQRERNALASNGAQTAEGATAAARAVEQPRQVTMYQPPPPELNVITGSQLDETGTSITSTVAGDGSSNANGADAVAIGDGASAGDHGVAVGPTTHAPSGNDTAVGQNAAATGGNSTAVGSNAGALGSGSTAVGNGAVAEGAGSVAVGGADAFDDDCVVLGGDGGLGVAVSTAAGQIVLGADRHAVIIKGKLVIADSSGGLHRIVVSTGGVLSTVAYP